MGKEKSSKDKKKEKEKEKSSKKKTKDSGKKVVGSDKKANSTQSKSSSKKSSRDKASSQPKGSKVVASKTEKSKGKTNSKSNKPPAKAVAKKTADATKNKTSGKKASGSGKNKTIKTKPKEKTTPPKEEEEQPEPSDDGNQSEAEQTGSLESTATAKETPKKGKKVPPKAKPKPKAKSSHDDSEESEEEQVEQSEQSEEPEEVNSKQTVYKNEVEPEGSDASTQMKSSQTSQAQTAEESSAEVDKNESSESEAEVVKPKTESLEFTKPTINQIKKEKKEKPLSYSEKITGREFETLNDEITELNSGVQMLKHSYGSIIKSLVAMQNRRSKKKAAREAQQKVGEEKVNFLTTLSTCDPAELKTKSCLEMADKYDIERFINPTTREETFNELFEEIEDLNKKTEKLRSNFYDARGHFQRDKYEGQSEVKLNRAEFNEFHLWTKKLAAVVDDIARNYNDDLLNMFRLN
ncbi:hypothetical protein RDWZM_008323 [Blomia tropicalis]|uniref:Uncharacterized protein n=1 Tax=Blomia tropicalis TaxID=40697 RepID=A0A9Q0RLB3_BLOTA|nr:hypothetical protein RDWZM_008323 [Blomia tropicalis]